MNSTKRPYRRLERGSVALYIYNDEHRPFSVGRLILHRDDLQRCGIDTHAYVDVEQGGLRIGREGVRRRRVSPVPARGRVAISVPAQLLMDRGASPGQYEMRFDGDAIRVDFGGAA